MAATAALRAGAGKLQIVTCQSVARHVAAAVPESLAMGVDETPDGAIASSGSDQTRKLAKGADAGVLGPGFSPDGECDAS